MFEPYHPDLICPVRDAECSDQLDAAMSHLADQAAEMKKSDIAVLMSELIFTLDDGATNVQGRQRALFLAGAFISLLKNRGV